MTTAEALFYRIDNQMPNMQTSPSGLISQRNGDAGDPVCAPAANGRFIAGWCVIGSPFFRSVCSACLPPTRTGGDAFRAEPSTLGVIDSYGIELIHPVRKGRSPKQIGRKGLSNRRPLVATVPHSQCRDSVTADPPR